MNLQMGGQVEFKVVFETVGWCLLQPRRGVEPRRHAVIQQPTTTPQDLRTVTSLLYLQQQHIWPSQA